MIRIQQLNVEIPQFPSESEYDKYQNKQLQQKILKLLKIQAGELKSFSIVRRSLDARKRPALYYSYIVDVDGSPHMQSAFFMHFRR